MKGLYLSKKNYVVRKEESIWILDHTTQIVDEDFENEQSQHGSLRHTRYETLGARIFTAHKIWNTRDQDPCGTPDMKHSGPGSLRRTRYETLGARILAAHQIWNTRDHDPCGTPGMKHSGPGSPVPNPSLSKVPTDFEIPQIATENKNTKTNLI
jgi:hypothetical protein